MTRRQRRHEVYAEEFRFISSVIGPQGAVYRLADAYGLSIAGMRGQLHKCGINVPLDAREVPA